jgi:hypothetical protein
MSDTEKATSREAAKRMHIYVMTHDLPIQVCLDIGILISRLILLEGKGWLKEDDDAH